MRKSDNARDFGAEFIVPVFAVDSTRHYRSLLTFRSRKYRWFLRRSSSSTVANLNLHEGNVRSRVGAVIVEWYLCKVFFVNNKCLINIRKKSDRMTVVDLNSQQEYENHIKSQDLSVVHFYAPWASQCTQINDVIEEMSKLDEYKGVKFAKIEAEKVPDVSLKTGITAVPTVVLARNDSVVDRVNGANPSAIAAKVKYYLVNKESVPIEVCKPKENLEDRLKKLINQSPCMLFMKGNPANPRCGFSRTIVSILDSCKADYQSFDILQDNDVREGLKKFSNWPTYPQLYVNGELIGGLDIVREMSESGELESMLPKKS